MSLASRRVGFGVLVIALTGGLIVLAQDKKPHQDGERKIQEAEAPAAAVAALKRLAGSATITQFTEETEHGVKYYEGTWQSADGKVDGLVTETGDVVEIEEKVPADKVPASVRTAVQREAGDAALHFERKTLFLYEVHYKKDGKGHELIYSADGRRFHEDEDEGDEDDEDDDD